MKRPAMKEGGRSNMTPLGPYIIFIFYFFIFVTNCFQNDELF